MSFDFNVLSVILFSLAALLAILAIYTLRKGNRIVYWFALSAISAGIWCVGYGFELASSTLNQALIFVKVEYIGITSLPIFWFLFTVFFSQTEHLFRRKYNYFLIALVPIATLISVWTTEWHPIHYQSIKLIETNGLHLLSFQFGIGYILFTIYFYCLLLISFYLIINKVRNSASIYKKQNYTLIFAALIPWISDILYKAGITPLHDIDLSPFAFSITVLLTFYSIFRFKLFDILPIARQKIFDLIEDGILVIDEYFLIVDSNKNIRKFLPIKKSQHQYFLNQETVNQLFPSLIPFIKLQRNDVLELTDTKDLEPRHLEVSTRIVDDPKTLRRLTIIQFKDVTAIWKLSLEAEIQKDKLDKLDKLKTRIFSIISHDLRGPLVNLTEVLKMLSENELSQEEFEFLTPNIRKDINYTVNLLENLLHWSRGQLAGGGIKREFINFTSLAKSEMNHHQSIAKQKDVTLTLRLPASCPAYVDRALMQIILRNLLSNAIKFCNENDEITISANDEHNQWLIIQLADTGVGMEADEVVRMFSEDNFSKRGTNNERGTGLGMIICKEFMQKMGGNISVESKKNVGTKFNLWLPKSDKNYSLSTEKI